MVRVRVRVGVEVGRQVDKRNNNTESLNRVVGQQLMKKKGTSI